MWSLSASHTWVIHETSLAGTYTITTLIRGSNIIQYLGADCGNEVEAGRSGMAWYELHCSQPPRTIIDDHVNFVSLWDPCQTTSFILFSKKKKKKNLQVIVVGSLCHKYSMPFYFLYIRIEVAMLMLLYVLKRSEADKICTYYITLIIYHL